MTAALANIVMTASKVAVHVKVAKPVRVSRPFSERFMFDNKGL